MKRRVAVLIALIAIVSGCTDDTPVKPEAASGPYFIRAYVGPGPPGAPAVYAVLDRQDPDAPPAVAVSFELNGEPGTINPCCSSDESAVFNFSNAEYAHGRSYAFKLTIAPDSTTFTLTTPEPPPVLVLLSPPADSLRFTPGVPIGVRWCYDGAEPTEFGVAAMSSPSNNHIPTVYIETVGKGERAWVFSENVTSAWEGTDRVRIVVQARDVNAVVGPLVAAGSFGSAVLAEASLSLTP